MPLSIHASAIALFYLLLVASVRAQVNATNCTDTALNWVGSLCPDTLLGR